MADKLNWDDAKYLLAVARSGQMLGAARRLGVNQATLSRRIAALEDAIGVKLVHRRTNGCDLTAEGRMILSRLERIEAEFLDGQAELTGRRGEVAGTVRLGTPDGFGISFLAPRLRSLLDAHPAMNLELVPVPRVFSLSQREADLAVMVGQPEKGRLKARKLTDYTIGLYASRDYLDAMGMPERLEDLNQHRIVGYVDDLIPTAELNYGREVFPNRQPNLAVSSAIGQFEAVRSGAGIGILHDFIAATNDGLVRILPDLIHTRSYWIAWHPALQGTPRVRAVIDFLVELVLRHQADFIHRS